MLLIIKKLLLPSPHLITWYYRIYKYTICIILLIWSHQCCQRPITLKVYLTNAHVPKKLKKKIYSKYHLKMTY